MVHGTVAPGFEPVRDVFARHFEEAGEVGASVCVIRDGQPLVDLWGGLADPTDGTPWEADTLVNIFSTSKGVVAHAVLRLVDQGLMDLDAPVAEVWPDFARNGKAVTGTPWRDTELVDAGERVRIAFVANNPGKWVFHCHMLEHQAAGMITWLEVVDG